MNYLVINGTEYMVRVGEGRGRRTQVENRRRAIDGSLLVDSIANKHELPLEITGSLADGRFFTPAEANTLMATLLVGSVAITGEMGAFTARARDIAWVDGQQYNTDPPTLYRWVTCVLEEI